MSDKFGMPIVDCSDKAAIQFLSKERDRLSAENERLENQVMARDAELWGRTQEILSLKAENAELVKILSEIGNANEAQVAPVYSELARAALAKVKESGK